MLRRNIWCKSLIRRSEGASWYKKSFSALRYEKHGQPEDVLEMSSMSEQEMGRGEVLVDWLAVGLRQ